MTLSRAQRQRASGWAVTSRGTGRPGRTAHIRASSARELRLQDRGAKGMGLVQGKERQVLGKPHLGVSGGALP